MGNGRRAKAPCGHLGEVVIGTYVQCLDCDRDAIPEEIEPEETRPILGARCPVCASMDIEEFEQDLDALIWYLNSVHIPTRHPMPPQRDEWGCNSCGRVFAQPA